MAQACRASGLWVLAMLLFQPSSAFLSVEHGLSGTETLDSGLTDKQLAVLRWIAGYTFVGDGSVPEPLDNTFATGIYASGNLQPQQWFDSARYDLALTAYATVFATAAATPAYTELARLIVRNISERLIDGHSWSYGHGYWSQAAPWCSEPVGHRAPLRRMARSADRFFLQISRNMLTANAEWLHRWLKLPNDGRPAPIGELTGPGLVT